MTGNADNLAAPSCKIGAARAEAVFASATALSPTFPAGAHAQVGDHATSLNHYLGGREQNSSAGRRSISGWTTLEVSLDGKVKITCPESLAQYARAVFNARVVSQIRRHVTSFVRDAPDMLSSSGGSSAEPMCVIDITGEVDAASGRESSSISPISTGSLSLPVVRSASGAKSTPRNILKRRMSALTPPVQDEDPKKVSLYGTHSNEGHNISEDPGSNDEGEESDNSPPPPPIQTSFRLDETEIAMRFLGERFCDLQQATCKVILKDWIKRIEPKKQSKFPYAASNPDRQSQRTKEKAPDTPIVPPWWPREIRHKEPDHIAKDERRALFLHLVRLYNEDNFQDIIDPNVMQDVRKCGWINVLEESTKLKTLQIDRENDQGVKLERRKKILHDIYHCARSLEEVWAGEIDPDTRVSYQNPATLARRTGDRKNRNRNSSKSNSESQTGLGSEFINSASGRDDEAQGVESNWEICTGQDYEATQAVNPFALTRHSGYPGNELTSPESTVPVDVMSPGDAKREQQSLTNNFSLPYEMQTSIMAPKATEDMGPFMIDLDALPDSSVPESSASNPSVSMAASVSRGEASAGRSYMTPSTSANVNFQGGKAVSAIQPPILLDEAFRSGGIASSNTNNAALRKQLRPLLPASGEHSGPYAHPITTYSNVDQFSPYSTTHLNNLAEDPQPMDVTPTDPPYQMKSGALNDETRESSHGARYEVISSDASQHVFGFAPEANEFQTGSSMQKDTFVTQELATPNTLQTGQQYDLDSKYTRPMYGDNKSLDCTESSPSVFQSPISSATFSNFGNPFAEQLSITYPTTNSTDAFQGSAITFSGCSDYSFYSSSEMASPTSLYGGTSASSTMAQSPISATQAYPSKTLHGLSMNRPMSSLGSFSESIGATPYRAPAVPAMRKFQNAVAMYASDIKSSSANTRGEGSMDKAPSPHPQVSDNNPLRTLSLDIPNSARSGNQEPQYSM